MTHCSQAANAEVQMSNLKTERVEKCKSTGKENSKLLMQFLAQSLSKECFSSCTFPIPSWPC